MHITINQSTFSTCFNQDFKMAEKMRKGAGTPHVQLAKGTPKVLGHGSSGAVFLGKCDSLCEVVLKVYKRRGDRDTEHKMMALIATSKTR